MSWDQTGKSESASLQLARPAQQPGLQKFLFPEADTPFRWVGHSFLWSPSAHLPTQVKGGHGRGWEQWSYIKAYAIPAPSPLSTHSSYV